MADIFIIYYVLGLIVFFIGFANGVPEYISQVVFWPLWIVVEVILSTIRWIKSIKV